MPYRKGEEPDFSEALIVRQNSTIEDVCDQVHRTMKETFKYAMVWGVSARHVPQRVGLSHVVADEDVENVSAQTGIVKLPGVVSRKKQLAPQIMMALQQ